MSDAATQFARALHGKRLAFGCEQLGGYEWGAVDAVEVTAAVGEAVERGLRLFDTADCYGRGRSETLLGQVLAPHRAQVLIATKFGVRLDAAGRVTYDSSPEWAEQALEESLRRLRTETVDLFQMHYWDGVTPLPALFDRLERLRGQGRIRWYGVTNFEPRQGLPAGYPGLVSGSLEYSLIERRHERAAGELLAAGLAFLSYGSLGQGLLSGKYRSAAGFGADDRRSRPQYRNFHGERLQRNLRIVEKLEALALRQEVTAAQLAIAWALQQLPGSAVLVGIKRVAQLTDLLGALDLKLPEAVRSALDEVSRI